MILKFATGVQRIKKNWFYFKFIIVNLNYA